MLQFQKWKDIILTDVKAFVALLAKLMTVILGN